MSPEQINCRAQAIRLDRKALALLADRSEKAVGATLGGRSKPRYDSLEAIENALIAEERRMLNYLLSLYPPPRRRAAA
ncbi:hypothetical protein JQ633_12410 [Bradyrhizobium tropiciagri]|uniref:hypothetical protein n=1 Tax=Bradyrhizobium tropiciagri TaxID=312253 RepID=UPI001BACF3F9|nr:hypothetical protein [Bradyrhizobium tropiciagri]MBR0871166.1 hypothetical protein [Bradyrhizobium tropiciagri]